MQNNFYLYNVVDSTKVLGAGNRFAVWVQGCDKRCVQCIAPDSRSKDSGGYILSVAQLAKRAMCAKIDGVTISGGEPFLQSSQVLEFIKLLKSQNNDLNFIIYTGFKFDELIKNEEQKKILESIDLLIDGEYIHEKNKDTPLIGSTNQGVYILSEEGRELAEDMANKQSREIEVVIKNVEDVFIVGIPPLAVTSYQLAVIS